MNRDEERYLLDRGYLYQYGDDSKYFCTFSEMEKICQVAASVAPDGLVTVHGQHGHVAIHMKWQERQEDLVTTLKQMAVARQLEHPTILAREALSL